MSRVVGLLTALALSGCTSTPPMDSSAVTMQFHSQGCVGDWPSNEPQETTVIRSDADGITTFQIRHPASCGLNVQNPAFSVIGNSIEMRYEMYSPNDKAIMCDCDYRATFSFSHLPAMIRTASFEWSENKR